MYSTQSIQTFLESSAQSAIIDVRSEAEFNQGHIPEAKSISLLNNEERAIVGTIYKLEGNRKAVEKGFELVGAKFASYIEQAKSLAVHNKVHVYCWRGGMRSNIMAWLFSTAGFEVVLLKGGYKAYRNEVIKGTAEKRKFTILGGKTGSGKTELLTYLKAKGEQVIDLEQLAHHKGSAFGGIGQESQVSNEQFENDLFMQLQACDASKTIWLENESRVIGANKIPDALYLQMRQAKVIELVLPIECRIERICKEYGNFPKELLEMATKKIEKKLGNLRMRQALTYLHNNELALWAEVLLGYYDDFYLYGMSKRDTSSIYTIQLNGCINEETAEIVRNIHTKEIAVDAVR